MHVCVCMCVCVCVCVHACVCARVSLGICGYGDPLPVRPTTRQFLDWDRKREQAQLAMKVKVEPDKVQYPTLETTSPSPCLPVLSEEGEGLAARLHPLPPVPHKDSPLSIG